MIRYAAVLLSRQPLRPTATTPWVAAAVRAVRWLKENNWGLISSTGLQTWELLTALASLERIPLKLILPVAGQSEYLVARASQTLQFALDRSLVHFVAPTESSSRTALMAVRDGAVVDAADLLVPVSIRSGGTMAELLEKAEAEGRPVERRFATDYQAEGPSLKLSLEGMPLPHEIESFTDDLVIHWTRATSYSWPQERLIEYYIDIIKSDTWPRSGFNTLRRILDSRRIIASPRHMPNNISTVSFSALRPAAALPLMKWRARYGHMTFEPYGIGLRRSEAEAAGILPVTYYDREEDPKIDPAQLWQWQSKGIVTDWTAEEEYRYPGDVTLVGMAPDAVTLFCLNGAEAAELRSEYPYRVLPFLA